MYVARFQLDADQRLPNDSDWTGAEIASCCRLAALLDQPLLDAARHVVPVAATASESIERLRSWASGRCLSADAPGIYHNDAKQNGRRRTVNRNSIGQLTTSSVSLGDGGGMQTPDDLSRAQLITIVQTICDLLFADQDDSGAHFWNPDKEWSGADMLDVMAELLAQHGLAPPKRGPLEKG